MHSARLVDSRKDSYEIYTIEFHRFSLFIYGPIDIEATLLFNLVGVVVGIAPIIGIQNIIVAYTTFVYCIVGQSCATKGELVT